jgi:hypothetical protein
MLPGFVQGKVSYEAALSTFMGDLDALVTAKKQNEVCAVGDALG